MLLPRTVLTLFCIALAATSRPAAAQIPRPAPPAPGTTATPAAYQPPKPLQRPPLSYPELAKLNRVTGVLRLLLTVDETGQVVNAELLRGSGSLLLDQVITDPTLKKWTFQPATLEGRPVTGSFEQEIEMRLDPEEQRALAQRRAVIPPTAGTPDAPYPEAARARALRGRATLLVTWDDTGLVERIGLQASSGSGLLDVTALRWAFEHWRVDRTQFKEPQFVKTMVFDPDRPDRAASLANATPPPLATPTSSPTPTPAATPKKR